MSFHQIQKKFILI